MKRSLKNMQKVTLKRGQSQRSCLSKDLSLIREECRLNKIIPDVSLPHRSGRVPFGETIWVAQQELGIVKGNDEHTYVGSPYFRNCSMLVLWNASTHDCAVFHVSNKTCVFDVARKVKALTRSGRWSITMAGGAEHGVRQSYLGGRRYNWVLSSLLHRVCSQSERMSFHYKRPSGLPPVTENDMSYLLDKETGEVFSVDNHLVIEEEESRPESLGPYFTERFNAANLVPYFAEAGFPCVLAYSEGSYTNARPLPCEKLIEGLSKLEIEYRKAQSGKGSKGLPGIAFVQLLKRHMPYSRYLITRCEREPMMQTYMQEQLLIFWGMKNQYPVPS